ncbi:MAG: histidine kinase [Solirubrobacteraceae bacterium]
MAGAPAQLEFPGLLPSVLVPNEDGTTRRSTRDWIVDTTCFLLALVLGIALLAEEDHRAGLAEEQWALDALVGFACCCALWLRRRYPVGVLAALTLPAAVLTSPAGAALIAFFTVAVHRPFRYVAIFSGISLAAFFLYTELHPDDETPLLISFAVSASITIAVAAWGMFVRARRQLVHSLRERAERAEAERQEHAERARLQERARIAREMHDVLAHRISLLSMQAGALEFRPGATPDEIARAAGVIRASAHQALQDLREVIGVLRETPGTVPEPPQPTLADLSALVDESRAAGMVVRDRLRIEDVGSVPAAMGRNAYRIVPEGLTNARRHAPGTAVVLTLSGRPGDGLEIEVRNPMGTFRPERAVPAGSGAGIIGLSERAHLAGGKLEHGRTQSGDHRLWAWLPWPA